MPHDILDAEEELDPLGEAGVFGGIFGVGIENVLDVGFAVRDVQGLDVRQSGEHSDNSLVGLERIHGLVPSGGVGMNAKLAIDETANPRLQTILEAVLASGHLIINRTTGKVLMSKEHGIHFRMNCKIILHRALGESHFGLVGTLN